jgi:hypothetical protein
MVLNLNKLVDVNLSHYKKIMNSIAAVVFMTAQILVFQMAAYAQSSDFSVIIDNGDPGYKQFGNWVTVPNTPDGYGGDWAYAASSPPNSAEATWTVNNLSPGYYSVQMTWVPHSNRATNAYCKIRDDSAGANFPLGVLRLNQKSAPLGPIIGGKAFQSLGVYAVTTGTLSVDLSNFSVDGYIIADAVRIVKVNKARADFDGDGKTDLSIFRPSEGSWYINSSSAGAYAFNWGIASDQIVSGDFDGDGKNDYTVFRANEGKWYIANSASASTDIIMWGVAGDIAVSGDFIDDDLDADDLVVFRPSNSTWYVMDRFGNTFSKQWGQSGDRPVSGDFDGDDKSDFAVFRPSEGNWYIWRSSDNSAVITQWGVASDIVVPADYDGDGKDDIAVFRPSEGNWYILQSSKADRPRTEQAQIIQWGISTDLPVPGDYDGDGIDDIAVFRPSEGTVQGNWYILRSSKANRPRTEQAQLLNWGISGDKLVPNTYTR